MTQQLYQDITGNLNSPQDAENVSIASGFRTSMLHFVGSTVTDEQISQFFGLGGHSYFSESAYKLSDWQTRYWGEENYKLLLTIK